MTQTLARSALALFASTALSLSAVPASAAKHHHRHHHAAKASHRASADADASDAGGKAASGRVVDVEVPGQSYTVRKGDTLQKIADKLDSDVAELKRVNHIRGSAIKPGQVIKTSGATAKAYVARSGDSLAEVARRFGVSEASLRAENGLGRRSRIHAGQKLRLPAGYRDRGATEEEAAQPVSKRIRGRIRPEAPASEEAAGEETSGGRSVTGRVVEVAGAARTYRVRKGDTLEKIADKLDTDVAQLKRDNHLRRSHIRAGQVLKGPRGPAKAYVVGPGDTIYAISRRVGVSVEALRAENGLSRRASIHTGEKLRLPAGYRDRGSVTTTIRAPSGAEAPPVRRPAPPPPETALPTAPRPYVPPARPYAPPPPTTTAAPPPPAATPTPSATPSDAQITELGRGKFVWPLKGDIVSDFGPKVPGQRNDGVNIKADPGAPVRAAAGGDVVYAGDQVPGFGNLVLIKHPDGWVTAYAHLSRVEVKMQQKVTQGQEIGQAGQTGGVSEPQLHFEVRYAPNPSERARPVDPKLVLPK